LFLSLRSKTAWESRFSRESFRTCGKQLAAQAGLGAGAVAIACRYAPTRYAALPIPRCICTCGKQLAAGVGSVLAQWQLPVATLQPAMLHCQSLDASAPVASSSPRKSGSLLV
jgi:hypothetical protein